MAKSGVLKTCEVCPSGCIKLGAFIEHTLNGYIYINKYLSQPQNQLIPAQLKKRDSPL